MKGRSTIDLTSSDSPQRLSHANRSPVPYLPTPVTTTKHPAKQPRALVSHAQRPPPVTPTKVRPIPEGSGLLSPPLSSQLSCSRTEDIIPTSPIAPAASPNHTRSGTVVPSSQTQVLEIDPNPFLSPKRTSPRQRATFKLPKLPLSSTIRTPAFNLYPTVNDDDDEDTCVIPSSQTQELAYHRPLTPPARLHIHSEDPTAGEIIPDSQPPEVAYSPTRRRTQPHVVEHEHPMPAPEQGPDGEHTQRDIVPTSQSAFEKEISSSDLLDIKSRFPVPAEPSGVLDQTNSKAPDTIRTRYSQVHPRERVS
ncbi:hypothetical protein BC629DRAFT_991963 [Irpex lacteus]|nr:hypothetical protein BC629DRAFT_991963 [Irpex lacteus]